MIRNNNKIIYLSGVYSTFIMSDCKSIYSRDCIDCTFESGIVGSIKFVCGHNIILHHLKQYKILLLNRLFLYLPSSLTFKH